MTLKTKVTGKLGQLSKRADMLGAIVGYFGTFANLAKAEGIPFTTVVAGRHMNAIKIHNFKNISVDNVGWMLTHPEEGIYDDFILMGATALVGGAVVAELPSMVPWQKSAAAIAKKAGFGMALAGLAAYAVCKLAEGSGGSIVEKGGATSTSGSSGPVTTTGRVSGVRGSFAPPTPYQGAWARPS